MGLGCYNNSLATHGRVLILDAVRSDSILKKQVSVLTLANKVILYLSHRKLAG